MVPYLIDIFIVPRLHLFHSCVGGNEEGLFNAQPTPPTSNSQMTWHLSRRAFGYCLELV